MPPIEVWKEAVGFERGPSALYKSWRDATKLQMTFLGIRLKSGSPPEKWARLTEWTLKKRPFRSQAHHHSSDVYRKAVDGLLMDVAKKRAHTLRGHVDLDERGTPDTPPPGMYLLSNSLSSGEANPTRTDPCLSVGSSCRYVRIIYHNPDRTRSEAPAGSFWESLTWRVSGCLLFWGVLEAPTMSSLAEMICREVEVVMRRGKLPRYLVGATAEGQRVLLAGGEDPLHVEDMIFLRTDHHVRIWWSVGGKEHLDLLLVVRRKDEDQVRGREVTPQVGHIPYLPRTLFGGLDSDSPEEEEEEEEALDEEEEDSALDGEQGGEVREGDEEGPGDVRRSRGRTSASPLFLKGQSLLETSAEREVSITRSPNRLPTPVLPPPPPFHLSPPPQSPPPSQPPASHETAEGRQSVPADVAEQVTETGAELSDEDREIEELLAQAMARRAKRAKRAAEKAEREKAERAEREKAERAEREKAERAEEEKAERAERAKRETAAPPPPRAQSPLPQSSTPRKTAEGRPPVPAGVPVVELSDEDLSIEELVRTRKAKRAKRAEKETTALSQPEQLLPPLTPSAPRERPSVPPTPTPSAPRSAKKRKKTWALLPPPTTPARRPPGSAQRSGGTTAGYYGGGRPAGEASVSGGDTAQGGAMMERASSGASVRPPAHGESSRDGARGDYGGKKASRGRAGRASELVDSDYEDM